MSAVIRIRAECTGCEDVCYFGVEIDGFGEDGDDLAFGYAFAVVREDVVV